MKITHKRQMWAGGKPRVWGRSSGSTLECDRSGQGSSLSAIANQFWDQLFASQNNSAPVSDKTHTKVHALSVQEDSSDNDVQVMKCLEITFLEPMSFHLSID